MSSARNVVVYIYVSREEREALNAWAVREHTSLSAALRALALKQIETPPTRRKKAQ